MLKDAITKMEPVAAAAAVKHKRYLQGRSHESSKFGSFSTVNVSYLYPPTVALPPAHNKQICPKSA